jgi:hypothetical protein
MQQNERSKHSRGISFFISALSGVPNSFPINQWEELLPQTVLTLNMLRQSNVAPNILAWAYHNGSFDYNRMPIAPMGCEVKFHIKPARRKSFGEHSEDGFYLRTSERKEDKSKTISGHSVLQTSLHHSTDSNASRGNRQCIQQTLASTNSGNTTLKR